MITTERHARAVQERRHKYGKRGFAKAVRRYFKRTGGQAAANDLPHTFNRTPNPSI